MSGKSVPKSKAWVDGSGLGGTAWKVRVSEDKSQKTKYVLRLETKHGAKPSGGISVISKVCDAFPPSAHELSHAFACFIADLAAARRQDRPRRDCRGQRHLHAKIVERVKKMLVS